MMIARSADNTPSEDIYLTFEPANAFLHITLDEAVTGLTAVMVEGCEGEVLTGDYTCRFDDGTTRMSASGTTRITVANPSGDFYVALPAVTLNKGYRLTFYRGSERMIKTYGYDTGKTLTKGGVYGVNIGSFTPVSADLSGVYTNYDIYRLQGAAAANALDGMTIFADNIIVRGVPSKLIDEVSLRIDGEQVPVVFDSAGADGVVYKVVDGIKTFVKNARADYAVAATITVDGQNCEYTRTVSVTGLPLRYEFLCEQQRRLRCDTAGVVSVRPCMAGRRGWLQRRAGADEPQQLRHFSGIQYPRRYEYLGARTILSLFGEFLPSADLVFSCRCDGQPDRTGANFDARIY